LIFRLFESALTKPDIGPKTRHRAYYIRHVVIIMWPTSVSDVASFINCLLWPHGIVKCPSYAHVRISNIRTYSVGVFFARILYGSIQFRIQHMFWF